MHRCVGLDVYLRRTTIAVICARGKRTRTLVVETNGQALVEAIRPIAGKLHICLEEGTQSAWLVELLRSYAEEIVVSLPDGIRGPKNDKRDAWKLAEELQTDAVRISVYKASAHLATLQCAARGDLMTAQDLVRVRSRLKGVFRSRGIITDASVYTPEPRATGSRSYRGRTSSSPSFWVGSSTFSSRCDSGRRSGSSPKSRPTQSSGSWALLRAWDARAPLSSVVATAHRCRPRH